MAAGIAEKNISGTMWSRRMSYAPDALMGDWDISLITEW